MRCSRIRRTEARLLVALALIGAPSAAVAQQASTDEPRARDLFHEARDLMASGRYAEACPKLEESQRLDPGIGTQFNLADCYEHTGRPASAWVQFLEVEKTTRAAGKLEHAARARERADALAARMTFVVVDVPDASRVPGLELARDGVPLEPASWGTKLPVDPGTHELTASATRRKPWERTFDVPVEPGTTTIAVPVLEDDAPPPPPPSVPQTVPPPPLLLPSDVGAAPGRTQRTLALASGGAGIVAVGVGLAFGVESLVAHNDSAQQCNAQNACTTQDAVDRRNDAVRFGTVSTWTTGTGLVAVAAGVTLWLTAPSRAASPSALRITPMVGASRGGVMTEVAW